MSTTRIKEKISKLVASQLPEFIQTDYTTFVAFLEAYYEFLEQDQGAFELIQNARSYNDLDKTTDSFVNYFLNTYARDIPLTAEANKRFLIKRIKDLYEAKGSELSFKYLFNLLFQADVDVVYPYENILRASDGKWQQRNSLRILTVSGDRNEILNRSLLYTKNGQVYSTPIVEVKNLSSTLTEVFLDVNLLAPIYSIGDTVEVRDSDSIIFSGTIDPTTTTYNVSRAGSGFKAGQIYSINFGGGTGTLVRVSNVTTGGGVAEIKFLTYGGGYPNVIFTVDLDPAKTVSEIADVISDRTQGFASYGSVLEYDPTDPSRYFLETYVSPGMYTYTSSTSFSDNVFSAASSTSSKPANYATIQFNPGALGRYPGSFISNEGFISELDIRLENDLLYQPFAYQTNTEIDIAKFFGIVTQLIHPAGQRLFNNRILLATVDVNANVEVVSHANLFTEAYDTFDTPDTYTANVAKSIGVDSSNVTQFYAANVNKPISDSTVSLSETFRLFQSVFNDNVSPTEATILDIATTQSDIANVIEEVELTLNKEINSNIAFSESGLGTIQSYFAESYVAEDYVGSSFTLI